jgi:5-methylcytosine-specific restriction endonuclease McrA
MENKMKLLTRDEFRNAVFERDGHRCVICGNEAREGVRLDAHHIIERRLWTDGATTSTMELLCARSTDCTADLVVVT